MFSFLVWLAACGEPSVPHVEPWSTMHLPEGGVVHLSSAKGTTIEHSVGDAAALQTAYQNAFESWGCHSDGPPTVDEMNTSWSCTKDTQQILARVGGTDRWFVNLESREAPKKADPLEEFSTYLESNFPGTEKTVGAATSSCQMLDRSAQEDGSVRLSASGNVALLEKQFEFQWNLVFEGDGSNWKCVDDRSEVAQKENGVAQDISGSNMLKCAAFTGYCGK